MSSSQLSWKPRVPGPQEGYVYVMTYTDKGTYYFKISSSKDPQSSLQQVQREERNSSIRLVGQVQADEMPAAEKATKDLFLERGLLPDTRRGPGTDWYKTGLHCQDRQFMTVLREAVFKDNARASGGVMKSLYELR